MLALLLSGMDKNFYKTYFETEGSHWWFRVRRNIIRLLIKEYKIPKTAKIFDFGCGSGYNVGFLQRLGFNASGADISAEAIEFGRSRGIRNLEVVNNSEIRAPEGGFDLIMTLDVIEHIEDDLGAIRAIERALKPGGRLIIAVPAYQWLWGVQDEVAHHFRRYTAESLSAVINKNPNLKILRKTYFNTFLFLPIVAVRLLSRLLKLKARESDFEINNPSLNSLFYAIFNLETYFLKFMNFSFGISILMVIQKNEI